MKEKMSNLIRKDGFQTLLASLVCILGGLLVGYVVLLVIEPSGAFGAITAVMKSFFRYPGALKMKYFGQTLTRTTYGVTTLSAKCENLPLAVSWCDWFFSTEGADFSSWGPEGITWEYDAEGNRTETYQKIYHIQEG